VKHKVVKQKDFSCERIEKKSKYVTIEGFSIKVALIKLDWVREFFLLFIDKNCPV